MKRGISPQNILYFNFEDDRLRPLNSAIGDLVIETFYELNPKAKTEGAYLFLDEVQDIPDWGIWLRRVVDTEKASVYVSGSSAHMLAAEIATEFRGRSLTSELLPFGFAEYLRYHNNTVPSPPFSIADTYLLKKMFEQYLAQGGFPAIQDEPTDIAISILQGYAKLVVARDVVERHNLNNPLAISTFSQQVLMRNGRELSLRKSEAHLRSQGVKVSRATLSKALGYFEDAIYLELRRRNPHRRDRLITTFKTKESNYEVDFAVGDALDHEGLQLVQVCVDAGQQNTFDRELRALRAVMAQTKTSEGLVITLENESKELNFAEGRILIMPAWDWILS